MATNSTESTARGRRAPKGVLPRLIRTVFSFYPVLLPITLVCILINAIVSSIPSVFMQNAIAVVEDTYESGDWASASGTIFMLLFTKVNKKGIVLLFGLIWAAMQLMSFWGVALVIAVGAVIAELFWRTLDRHKFSTMLLCFTVQVVFLYLGMTIPLIFMKDMYLAAVSAYADLYSTVFDMLIGPMFFVGLAATVVGCVVGAFLGKLLLKKHFQKAGIV